MENKNGSIVCNCLSLHYDTKGELVGIRVDRDEMNRKIYESYLNRIDSHGFVDTSKHRLEFDIPEEIFNDYDFGEMSLFSDIIPLTRKKQNKRTKKKLKK